MIWKEDWEFEQQSLIRLLKILKNYVVSQAIFLTRSYPRYCDISRFPIYCSNSKWRWCWAWKFCHDWCFQWRVQNIWKTTLCGLWCSCAIERAVEGFALTDHDFGNLPPSLSLPFRFLWREPFNKIGEGYFQYILEHCKCQFICVWNLNLKFINWDIVKGWNPESRIQHDWGWCQVWSRVTTWWILRWVWRT